MNTDSTALDLEAMLENDAPLPDPQGIQDPGYRALLGDLQANILRNHGKKHVHCFFIKFKAGDAARTKARGFLAELTRGIEGLEVSSEKAYVRKDIERNGEVIKETKWFVGVSLSASGYDALGMDNFPEDRLFKDSRSIDLADRPKDWEAEYKDGIDAFLMLACNDSAGLAQKAGWLKVKHLDEISLYIKEESGSALQIGGPHKGPIEQFGYRDGISQPLFYQSDIDWAKETRAEWDPFAPLKMVLVHDRGGKDGFSCGTYLAFRKLKQDVPGFYAEVRKLMETDASLDEEEALALLMGRYRDGTPLTRQAIESRRSGNTAEAKLNDFNFEGKAIESGQTKPICPFHAHIRKTNPRMPGETPDLHSRSHRIARRGYPYGPHIDRDPTGKPLLSKDGKVCQGGKPVDVEVGLLFISAQSSLENQFAVVQKWSNSEFQAVPEPWQGGQDRCGLDPIAGHPPANGILPNGLKHFNRYRFPSAVTLKGSAYFFTPSISSLSKLSDPVPNQPQPT